MKRAEEIRNIEEDEKEGVRATMASDVGTEDKYALVDLCMIINSFYGALTCKMRMKTFERYCHLCAQK